jgi:hypothetical protein
VIRSRRTRTAGVVIVLACAALASDARAQTAPRGLSILDVPFISQSEALCGGAAAAMVLRYWGERALDAESFAHLIERSAAGIRTTRLMEELRHRGWNAVAVEGRDDLIDAELIRGHPVLTLIEDRPGAFHYVVVVAATPQAIVFHDPARAPFRVMPRKRFARRWSMTDRWMAMIVPSETSSAAPAAPAVLAAEPSGDSSCEQLVALGIRHAQAGDLESAERSLTAALSCGGAAPLRELAGLRLLQRRWPEVSELASAAVAEDPQDAYAWQLLAASRFVQDDPDGALEAWNRIDQPHVDLVSVGGLTHTRQRVVERLLAVRPPVLLTPDLFDLSARRLRELPSASGTRLEFVPRSGMAELRAHVVERPLVPSDPWSYTTLGVLAIAQKEVRVSSGSMTGGGERVSAGWRFWRGRPRVDAAFIAPAPWGGLWAVDGFAERQPFSDATFATSRRASAGVAMSNWLTSWARVSARGGIDSWDDRGKYGVASGAVRVASRRDRVILGVDGAAWFGGDVFGSMATSVRVRSSTERRGRVLVARAGGGAVTTATPPDIWFAGDTGAVRTELLRAHPVVDDGNLQTDRLGRRIAHASGEAQRWWTARSVVQVGAAIFVDAAQVGRRAEEGRRGDFDIGCGLRIGFPGLDGVLRLDVGKGLRDGATAVSFVYEP